MYNYLFEEMLEASEARREELFPKAQPRNNGRGYRRKVRRAKDRRLRTIIEQSCYGPHRGYLDYGRVDGVWQPIGTHIKYPKASRKQQWIKRATSHRMRKADIPRKGNYYRRLFDYWNTMY